MAFKLVADLSGYAIERRIKEDLARLLPVSEQKAELSRIKEEYFAKARDLERVCARFYVDEPFKLWR
jgi:hypothetical protein